CVGTSFSHDFSTTASGKVGGSYTFYWEYYNGSNWVTVTNGTPSGVSYSISTVGNTSTLTISGTISTVATYNYRARVTDHCNNDVTEPFDLIIASGPTISTLTNASIALGGNYTFSPTVTGATSYQWYKDGNPISGATNSSYTISNAQYTDDGDYYLVASSACGSTTSNTAHLWVYPSTQASNINLVSRTNASITISWTRGNGNGVLVSAKQGTTNNVSPTNDTTYNANAYFPSAPWISGSGSSKAVYSGTGTSVTVTGLLPNTFYTFRLFEYNQTGSSIAYNTSTSAQNPRTLKTTLKDVAYDDGVVVGSYGQLSAVYPNPTSEGEIDFSYNAENEGEALVQIVSMEGVVLYSNTTMFMKGDNYVTIYFADENLYLSPGMYVLRVFQNGESLQQKFIYLP
ncbi:MAG: T9SS type A sorting domain-containing protein, partial [Candidatus Kapaibacteriales bacterium]